MTAVSTVSPAGPVQGRVRWRRFAAIFIPAFLAVLSKTSVSVWLVNFRVSAQTWVMACVVSICVGIFAGFIPAIQSSRLRIVDGLRKVV